jgi:exodeoxyribonuclease V alpha subunit
VLVGDADQLPPVGAGKPFAELVAAPGVPAVRIGHVFRQAARSMIVSAAHAINAGRRPSTTPGPDQVRDFFVLEEPDPAVAGRLVVELATERLPRHYDVDPVTELQVLSPIYRGPVGVDALNEALRARLNPEGTQILDGAFRVGDKLIQTRNDYETGLMNGQLLVVDADDPDREELVCTGDEGTVRVPYGSTGTLRRAYAISVHKSQGAEVPIAVICVHRQHAMLLSRNLLYTAVTRASRACVIVGESGALDRAIARADAHARHSRLGQWLEASR